MPERSGVHQWTLRWQHEPEKAGRGDAVGLCTEDMEEFGPSACPLLGGSATGVASLALYANGTIHHFNCRWVFLIGRLCWIDRRIVP
jgi:hypothetical protein